VIDAVAGLGEFGLAGVQLAIAGAGRDRRRLERRAAGGAQFLGRVPDDDLRRLYACCRAVLLPGEEDFGMTAVEAIASGKPVIALGRGGVLEIVPPEGAFFYDSPDEKSLDEAIQRFEAAEPGVPSATLQAAAVRFSETEFDRKMREVLYRV